MARKATGVDVGSRSAALIEGRVQGTGFQVTAFHFQEFEPGSDPWQVLEPSFAPRTARVGITGKDMNLRYSRVPRLPDWQLAKLMRFEVEEVGAANAVAADFNLLPELPEIEGEDTVLLAMVRENALEPPLAAIAAAGGQLDAFSPNAVGLYNAWLRYGVVMDDTVLLANVGHESTDVVLVRGADLVFARSLSGGSGLFEQALSERLGLSSAKARGVLEGQVDLAPGAQTAGDAERATKTCLGPAGQLASLIGSALSLARTQIKVPSLKLDRVFLSGRGTRVRGLERYLSGALSVAVERFDPFRVVNFEGLGAEAQALLERRRSEAVIALGLATAGSDPDAYSIEIVPAALERRRQFLGGTLFLIAAAVLAVAFVGYDAWTKHGRLESLRLAVGALERQERQASRTHARTVDLVRESDAMGQRAQELFHLAGSGEQAVRVLSALSASLPPNFWLTSVTGRSGHHAELGIERGRELPIVTVEGRAQEGIRPRGETFVEFLSILRGHLPEARIVERLSPEEDRFSLDLCLMLPPAPAGAGEETP